MADITNTCGAYYPIAEDTYRINSLTIWDIEGGLSLNWAVVYPSPLPPPQVTPPDAEYVEIIVVKASDNSRIAFLTVAYDYPSTDGRYEIEPAVTGDYLVFTRLIFGDDTSSRWTMTKVSYQDGDNGVDMRVSESDATRYITLEGMSTEVSIGDEIIGYISSAIAVVEADPVLLSGSYAEGNATVVVEVSITGTFTADEDIFLPVEVETGTDIIPNGNFAVGTGWTLDAGWSIGSGQLASVTATNNYAYPAAPSLEAGEKYLVFWEITGITGGSVRVQCGSSGLGPIRSSIDSFREILAQGGSLYFSFRASAGGFTGFIDNISAYKITTAGTLLKVESANVRLLEDGRKRALES